MSYLSLESDPLAGSAFDILIVEDDSVSRRALKSLVSSCGFLTDAVSSAEDALLCVYQNGAPKVALVDLDLPGMSGIDFIRRLKALSPTVFPVLMTAAEFERVARIRRQYPVAYLPKPLDFEQLLSLISQRRVYH